MYHYICIYIVVTLKNILWTAFPYLVHTNLIILMAPLLLYAIVGPGLEFYGKFAIVQNLISMKTIPWKGLKKNQYGEVPKKVRGDGIWSASQKIKSRKSEKELWMDLHTGTFVCVKVGHSVSFCLMSSFCSLKQKTYFATDSDRRVGVMDLDLLLCQFS